MSEVKNKHTGILLVDDDEDDRDVFAEALSQVDPAVSLSMAHDGLDAINKLQKWEGPLPDLIFLDLNMPRLGGKDFLVQIKQEGSLREIPVIIYSTSSNKEEKQRMAELGAAHFVVKHNSFDALRDELVEVLAAQW